VPVIVPSVKVDLPEPRNIAQQTKPEDIPVSVDVEGNIYIGGGAVDRQGLFEHLAARSQAAYSAGQLPPKVHMKADRNARYEHVARALYTIQTAGIIEKDIDGETKQYRFVRAETHASRSDAENFALTKGRQIIDEQGERLFRD